ncbi:helix-turn-helix domain-containing protein [Desulfosoma caldarium]|uniref:Cytoskeletal protein RodZ n=1 Tax=Desulfosoma caldarium TaxID=610254 RepID=A0A3N1UXK1_9BACT|nr:helix-turn-helix domain-containing protein [Desulfosoma caldarium]ROQ93267.1 cytoskeletal protein RodZ [Desulfosoma caldarium]
MSMDALRDIGAFLEGERKRQQISLEELSEHTRISVRMLQALEAGEYEVIGTPLLIRGFLKVYCQALGVDPQPILEEYGSDIRRYDNEGERLQRFQSWMKGTRKKSGPSLILFLVLALGVTVAGLWAVWWPKYQLKRAQKAQSTLEAIYPQEELPGDLALKEDSGDLKEGSLTTPAVRPGVLPEGESPALLPESGTGETGPRLPEGMPLSKPEGSTDEAGGTAPLPGPKVAESETDRTVGSASPHTLHIVADEEAWIQVQVDDEKPHSRILKPGESAQWTLSQSAQIWTGNAGGIRVSWDGTSLKPLGKRGEVLRVKLPDARYLENP